jgi:hypothetical protein
VRKVEVIKDRPLARTSGLGALYSATMTIVAPPITSPVNKFNTESYYLHGIDLGVSYNF